MAVEDFEIERLEGLYSRAQENGCTVEMIEGNQIKDIEPYCQVKYLKFVINFFFCS